MLALTESRTTCHHVLVAKALTFCLLMVGVTFSPVSAADKPAANAEIVKPKKGDVFVDHSGRPALVFVSEDELEIPSGNENIVCKYSIVKSDKQGDRLRVVVNKLGTTTAVYYELERGGMRNAKDASEFLYTQSAYDYLQTTLSLKMCADREFPEKLKSAVSTGNDVNKTPTRGDPLLCSVAGQDRKVEVLLTNGADPNASLPLHYAALHGNPRSIELLIAKGAKVDAKDAGGRTALHKAAQAAEAQAVAKLLELGADASAKDRLGNTPLHMLARTVGSNRKDLEANVREAVRLLIKRGADVNAKNELATTPLGEMMTSESAKRWRRILEEAGGRE